MDWNRAVPSPGREQSIYISFADVVLRSKRKEFFELIENNDTRQSVAGYGPGQKLGKGFVEQAVRFDPGARPTHNRAEDEDVFRCAHIASP